MKAYVDSNIFVYSMLAHPKFGRTCKIIIDDLQAGSLNGAVSTLVPAEVMSVAIKYNPSKATLAVNAIYSLPLKIVGLSRSVLLMASDLALKYDLSGYDAIHVATSLELGLENLISNDEGLKKVHKIVLVKPLDYEEWKKSW